MACVEGANPASRMSSIIFVRNGVIKVFLSSSREVGTNSRPSKTIPSINPPCDGAAACYGEAVQSNPRFAIALRFLAASLARQGEADKAEAVVREILDIEPELTLTKLRARLMFLSDWCWSRYSDGLRRAGLPE